jgi:cytoskeletal protein RodZ
MRIPSFCFMCLLIVTATACVLAAAAPDYSNASSNNATNATATLRETTMSNASLNSSSNLSAMNDSALNASSPKNIGPQTPFMIGGDANVSQTNNTGNDVCAASNTNASDNTSEIQPSNKTAFMIEGYTRPTRDAKNGPQCSLTAAYLSRGVEGTPHGYVTYYN